MKSIETVEKEFGDLTIAYNSRKAYSQGGYTQFKKAIYDKIPNNIIKEIEFSGLKILIEEKWTKELQTKHKVLAIKTPDNIYRVVDPFIARISIIPPKDKKSTIEDKIQSGKTPFADIPYSSTLEEYQNKGIFRWKNKKEK